MKSSCLRHCIATFSCLFVLAFVSGCRQRSGSIDIEVHRNEIEQWKEQRLTRLQRDDGWLTLAGLFWLKEGENRFGTDSTNVIVLPRGTSPSVAGSVWLEKGLTRLVSTAESKVSYRDSIVTALSMFSDADTAGPTIVSLGTVSFYVIKRGDQIGVRVKDKENPARLHFAGLEYFPIDLKWRVEATFVPYTPPKQIEVVDMVGITETSVCPGSLKFEIDGKQYSIDPVIERGSEDKLFLMLADETNGKETYAVGRQLYTPLPGADNQVIIDFNKTYNWPCVFTPYATCPIAPRQNHLELRIEAGERMYKGHE